MNFDFNSKMRRQDLLEAFIDKEFVKLGLKNHLISFR